MGFRLKILDQFRLSSLKRTVLACEMVEEGKFKIGDYMELRHGQEVRQVIALAGIEMFNQRTLHLNEFALMFRQSDLELSYEEAQSGEWELVSPA